MARIRDTRGRQDAGSGYGRLIGNEELGRLLSRMHATVIRNGNELEHLLAQRCPWRRRGLQERLNGPPGGLFAAEAQPAEVYFGERLAVPGNGHRIAADIVVLDNRSRAAVVVELKDGDAFDTKKAEGELASMKALAAWLERLGYTACIRFCSFNQSDEEAIRNGAKGRFSAEQVMTGEALCALIGVDHADVARSREADIQDNFDYFLSEIRRITGV